MGYPSGQVFQDLPGLTAIGVHQKDPLSQRTPFVFGAFVSTAKQGCNGAQQQSCNDGQNGDSASHTGNLTLRAVSEQIDIAVDLGLLPAPSPDIEFLSEFAANGPNAPLQN